MANPWDNDAVIRPAPAAPAMPSTMPAASPAPTQPAAATGNPWDNDTVIRSAPGAASPSASAPSSAPAGPSLGEQAARGVGIGVRGLVQGALDLPAMVSDNLIAKPVNAVLDATMGEGQGPRLQKLGDSANDLLTRAGLPEAQTPAERVVQDINRGAGGAAAGIGAGATLARTASPVAQAVGSALQAAPEMQLASGAVSGGASSVVREGGGGEGAQLAAGLAGALAPSVGGYAAQAGLRGALRGGEAGRQRVADAIQTFEEAAGTTPTLGQATGSRTFQAAETGLSNVIGGAGLMARRAELQTRALEDSVQRLSTELAPNATGWGAGEAITKGVNAFKDSVKTTQSALYRKLDELIPAQTPVSVNQTQDALRALNEGIEGAPNISQLFRNARIGGIERAMLKDLDAATQANVAPGMASTGVVPAAGQLPYQAVQKLRTLVGREISENSLTSDVPRSKWRALYAALSDDLGSAAAAAGPQAQQAWSRANQYTKASIQRLDQLESIVSRDAPEKVYKAATSGLSEGGTQISRLMKSMPLENRREVAAAVLQRLGRAKNSTQNEMGDAFSAETFLSNLAGMSGPARMALFSNAGFPGLRAKIEQMGRMAANRREGAAVFSNSSGTTRLGGMVGYFATLATALGSGNAPLVAKLAAAPVFTAGAAKLATEPSVTRFLSRRTNLNQSAAPATLAAAAREDDVD